MSDVEVEHRADVQEFVVDTPSGPAVLAYSRPAERKMEIRHTTVPSGAEGRGIGGALVRSAIGYARVEGLRVIPTCSFARGWLKAHPDEADVVA